MEVEAEEEEEEAEAEESELMTTEEKSETEDLKVESNAFNIGDIVEAHSLNAAVLNGKQGAVVGFQAERVKVQFAAEGAKALKPENLKLVEAPALGDERKAEAPIAEALGAHAVDDGSVQTGADLDPDESINEGLDHGKAVEEWAAKTSSNNDLTEMEELKQNVAIGKESTACAATLDED